jgi:ferredoxin
MAVSVRFDDDDVVVQAADDSKLTDICDQNRVSLLFGCREANCGTCLMEVLSGADALSPMTPNEREMLDIIAPDHPHARLACQCRVRGDVCIRALHQ